jgi:hypothetical protein
MYQFLYKVAVVFFKRFLVSTYNGLETDIGNHDFHGRRSVGSVLSGHVSLSSVT